MTNIQLKSQQLKVGDEVKYKSKTNRHQLSGKICQVMEVEEDKIKLIEKGSSLNQPQYWVSAKVADVELLSKSDDLDKQKDSLEDEVIPNISNNSQTSSLHSATKESQSIKQIKEEEIIENNSELSEQNKPTTSSSNQDKPMEKKQVKSSSDTDKVTDKNQKNSANQNPLSATKSESKLDDTQPTIDIPPLNNDTDNQPKNSLENSQNNGKNYSQKQPQQKSIIKSLKLEQITDNKQTQSRCQLDQQIIIDYAESMKNGAKFPPVIVFFDNKRYYLADGYHRLEAHKIAKIKEIEAEIKQGSLEDAILYSVGANETHGLRRTNADKKKAVKTVLQNQQWKGWSDNHIASICAVSHPFVGKIRKELYPDEDKQERTYTNKHGNVTTMKTKKIGQTKSKNQDNSAQSSLVDDQSSDNSTNPETTKNSQTEVNTDSTNPETTEDSQTEANTNSANLETTKNSQTEVNTNSPNSEITSPVNDSRKQSLDIQQLRDSITVIQKQIFQIINDKDKKQVTDTFNLLDKILAHY